MKRFFLLVVFALFTTLICNAQRGENISSKDTVSIDINKVTLVEKVSEKTGKTNTYLRFENRNYNTDGTSIKNFTTKTNTTTAYIIYNNYNNGERKVSKLLVKQ
jgi:hypothetical protein